MFHIHEDTENLENEMPLLRNENKISFKNKQIVDSHLVENRRVLARITNTRNFDTALAAHLPNAKYFHTVNHDKNTSEKSKNLEENASNRNMLKQACALVSYQVNSHVSPFSSDSSPLADVSMVSVCSVDSNNRQDILYTEPQYRKYIYNYLLESETQHRPHPLYMNKQPEITDDMRCILIDWLVSISDEYDFAAETLYLATSYIDRFLSKMSVVRSKLQLLGVTAMMIAAKYEEIHPPDTSEFSSLTKETCTVKQILKMEQLILRVLSFDLTTPTTRTFIDEFSIQCNLSTESIDVAMYISELCLVESVQFLAYLPSELAASSIALSRHTLSEIDMWPRELEELSGHSLTTLYPIVKMQHKVFEESPTKSLQAVRQKYNKESYKFISNLTPRKI